MHPPSRLPDRIVAGFLAVWIVLWCGSPPAVRAGGGDYDYAVERVTVDGNLWGPHDGVPDAVEESFDPHVNPVNGVPGSPFGFTIPFNSLLGTSWPTDGALHLMSPGTVVDLQSIDLRFILSNVVSGSPMLRDGAGDARVEVAFRAATPSLNDFVAATFSIGNVWVGLAFANFEDAVAQRQLGPTIAGFSMFAHILDNGLVPVGGQSIPVDPAAVGGPFVLAFDYDDTAKAITPSFSLDGGATFTGGFDPLPIPGFDGSGVAAGPLIIGADPRTPLPPACPGLLARDNVKVASLRSGSVLSFSARAYLDPEGGMADPLVEGTRIAITDRGSGGNLVDTAVPAGGPASGCDPRDGWYGGGGRSFKYQNYSNAFPPDCTPGSANGLVRLKVRRTTPSVVQLSAMMTTGTDPASIVGPMNALFVRGQGGNTDASGACLAAQSGDIPCATGPRRVRCKK